MATENSVVLTARLFTVRYLLHRCILAGYNTEASCMMKGKIIVSGTNLTIYITYSALIYYEEPLITIHLTKSSH